MYDSSTFEDEQANTLDLNGLLQILDSFQAFEEKWGAEIKEFVISGGDPLLRGDWREFLVELRRRGKRISILGNPETLTEEAVATLAELKVASFQMSLDGLESTHDAFRSEGSFRDTVRKLEILHRANIPGVIMFTLFPGNADQLLPLLSYVADHTRARAFDFDIGCFSGNAAGFGARLEPEQIRKLFSGYIREKKRLRAAGNPILVGEKSNLLKLTRFENGEFFPLSSPRFPVVSGCLAGWTSLAVLADGTVLACRRLPLKAGKMPEQSFEDIFLGAELLRKFRRPTSFAQCGTCDFYQFCRGCAAYVYSVTGGDPFAPHPLCFRSRIPVATGEEQKIRPGPPIAGGYQEEFDLIAGRFSSTQSSRFSRFLGNRDLRRLFVTLVYSTGDRRRYLADPDRYLSSAGRKLNDEERVFLTYNLTAGYSGEGIPARVLADLMTEKMLRPRGMVNQPELRELTSRAWADDGFKRDLLNDPKSTIEKALGVVLPPRLAVRVHEQTADTLHLCLPLVPPGLDEERGKPAPGKRDRP